MTFPYKHIIWDWNGTLFDDAWLCVDITNGLLRQRGLPIMTHQRYQEVFDFPVQDYYTRLGFDFSEEPFDVSATEFMRIYEVRRFECRLQEGVTDVLAHFETLGISQSILSAYQHHTLEEIIRHHDLHGFFSHIYGLRDYYARSKIDLGRALIRRLPHEPHDVVLIGDTRHDHEVAQQLGIDCILIPSGHHPRSKLLSCSAPVLDRLTDVLRLTG